MLAVRGDSRGYDKWANELGCPNWSFSHVEPYFRRLENFDSTSNMSSNVSRGKHGPIVIIDSQDKEFATKNIVEAFVQGNIESGIEECDDYNAPYVKSSASLSQMNIDNGKRCDTASAYLFGENGAFKNC